MLALLQDKISQSHKQHQLQRLHQQMIYHFK
jgi:hypothetical protein